MSEMLEKIKVYNIALGALRGCSEEACVSCICTESVFTRLKKRLEKVRRDLEESDKELCAKVDGMLDLAEGLPIKAEGTDCLMTRGICKLPKCITHDISEMLNLVKP